LSGLSDRVGVSTIEKFDPKNMDFAAGILFLSALELEIHLGGNSTPLDTQRKYFMLDTRRVKMHKLDFGIAHFKVLTTHFGKMHT
jgi:hypothetical protein